MLFCQQACSELIQCLFKQFNLRIISFLYEAIWASRIF